MKITIKLPGGGWIRYEKKTMSQDARADFFGALMLFGMIGFMLILILILK